MLPRRVHGAVLRTSAKTIHMTILTAVLCCMLAALLCLPACADNCIGKVKMQDLGSSISLTGRVVTGVYPGYFYIQDPESGHYACGIMVKNSVTPSYSDAVTITGSLAKDDNDELYIDASSVVITGTAAVPKALGRNNKDIGGGTQGVAAGPSAGVNTIGVLQASWGKASNVVNGKSMTISDGSGSPVKVLGPIHYISNDDYVRVVGIAGLEKTNGVRSRVLRVMQSNDAVALGTTAPPQTDPLIDLDASTLAEGNLSYWSNPGTLGGVFGADGTSPVVGTVAGRKCVTFDNVDRMKASFTAPAGITGNGDFTVVVWAYKTSLWPEMPLLSWARRGGDPGTCAQFNFGNIEASGVATHGGNFDMPFGIFSPSTSVWHQVAVTYDGSVEKAYVDGSTSPLRTQTLSIYSGQPVYLGCGYRYDGNSYVPEVFLPASIASVKVYDYALTAAELDALYSAAVTTYTVSGTVIENPSGATVAGAKVCISPSNPASADPGYAVYSGGTGLYSLSVPPGTWNLSVCVTGCTTLNQQIVVTDHNITGLNFRLTTTSTGEVFNLDASYLQPGVVTTWPTNGMQKGTYTSEGTTPTAEFIGGIECVTFDGTDRMKSDFALPFGMTANGDWSISMWVYNPSFSPEECVFSWAPRGGASGTGAQINFGNSPTFGAVTHSGTAQQGFAGGQPAPDKWHHIAVTFASAIERIYVDGVYNTMRSKNLSIAAGCASFLGCGYTFDGSNYYPAVPFSGSIGKVSVFDRALTLAEIQAQARLDLRTVRVMPLGDSITDGYNVPGGYRIKLWNSILAAGEYVDFVGSGVNGPTSLGDKDHEGHPGWQCSDLIPNIDNWMTTSRPKVVILHIGTNDIYNHVSAVTCIERLNTLLDKICAKLPEGGKVYVAQIIPWGGSSFDYLDPIVRDYNSRIPPLVQQKVAEGKPVYMVNMYGDASNPNGIFPSDLADGVHPTAAGYDKMADIWWNAIKDDLIY